MLYLQCYLLWALAAYAWVLWYYHHDRAFKFQADLAWSVTRWYLRPLVLVLVPLVLPILKLLTILVRE